jgi:hypothetical protein
MPKQKGKDGKMFSTHGVVKPKLTVKASCLGCHPDSTVEKKLYEIESIINYTKGKMRKSEYWLGQLIDTYAAPPSAWGLRRRCSTKPVRNTRKPMFCGSTGQLRTLTASITPAWPEKA